MDSTTKKIMNVSANFPFRLVSPNVQEHWSKRHRRNKKQAAVLKAWWTTLKEKPAPPCLVCLTRYATREMDLDNFIFSAKGIRDILGSLLLPGLAPGQADNKKHGIKFEYEQKKGATKTHSLKIDIQGKNDDL